MRASIYQIIRAKNAKSLAAAVKTQKHNVQDVLVAIS
jgi:hypothetical protein